VKTKKAKTRAKKAKQKIGSENKKKNGAEEKVANVLPKCLSVSGF
jgi:hypothetical protein